eukprot:c5961_g1_i1.p1 GENE.c5961_g1_i1~~c5961_g1_i1.p1  ORF type:complete len:1378 (-),score=299.66 c5961_g1_i1:162-3947(-)
MSNRIYSMDTQTFQWTRLVTHGRIPTPRAYHTIAPLDDDVFVFGGFDGRAYLNDLHKWTVFDSNKNETGVWKKLEQRGVVPEVRAAAASAVYGRKMFMFGGFEVSIYKNDFFVLDLDKLEWSRIHLNHDSCAMPGARAMASLTLVGTKLVLFGGVFCDSNGTCTELGDWHHYDISKGKINTQVATDPQPPARYGHTATLLGSKLVLFGGAAWPNLYNDLFFYDIYENKWAMPAGVPPYARKEHSMNLFTLNGQSQLVVFGGKHGSGGFSNHFHFFDIATSTWTHPITNGLGPGPRAHHATVMKDNTTLAVFGGYEGAKSLDELYFADLPTLTWTKVETVGAKPRPCHGHAVVSGIGQWFQFGGVDCRNDNCTFFNSLHSLATDSLSWRVVDTLGSVPHKRASHSFTTITRTSHYVFGGIGAEFTNFDDLYEFNEDSLSWVLLEADGAKPQARFGHAAQAHKGKLVIFGGANCKGVGDCTYFNDVRVFNPSKKSWAIVDIVGDAPAARVGVSAVSFGEAIYVLGGASKDRIFGELVTIRPDATVPANTIAFGAGVTSGMAGRNVKFFVQLQDSFHVNRTVGGDHVEATVFPNSRIALAKLEEATIDVLVEDAGNGLYILQYTTNVSDVYTVTLNVNGEEVTQFNTNVVADVPSPQGSLASGTGLNYCLAGQECEFSVELFDIFENKLNYASPVDVQFVGPKRVTKTVHNEESGTPVIRYIPEKTGNYSIHIRIRMIDVAHSPFNLTVHPGAASHTQSRVEGPGLQPTKAGDLGVVTLTLFDKFDNHLVAGGESIKARMEGPDDLECSVDDLGNGSYVIKYTAVRVGTYRLNVLLADQPISGSPFAVQIVNSAVSPASTFAYGAAVRYAVAGYRSYFTIQAADEFGNNMTTGGAKFNILFVGPGDIKIPCNVTDLGNGQYTASYMTTVAGDFMLSATLWSDVNNYQSIHMSPFLGTIVAAGADPLKSFVYVNTPDKPAGDMVFRTVMGVHNYFHIQAVDRYNNKKTIGGDKFSAELEGPVSHDAFISDNGDGTYTGTFVAPAAGRFRLKVYYGNVAVNGTPISVLARANFDVCPNSCNKHGDCVSNACECYTGYSGIDCSIATNTCPGNCMGNGACINNTCFCYPGFAGQSCQITATLCPNDCSKHGKCVASACVCDQGYDGVDCSDSSGLCPDKCSGNGECVSGSCLCYPGFKGANCANQSKFCPKGCSGRGNCLNSGLCSCSNGWTGLDCATQLLTQTVSSSSPSIASSLQPELPARLPRK